MVIRKKEIEKREIEKEIEKRELCDNKSEDKMKTYRIVKGVTT